MNPLFFFWKKKSPVITVSAGAGPGAATKLPDGFFHALSVSGKPGGYGFNCNKCHYHVPHSCPKSVKHCGGVDTLDPKAKLPTVRLSNPKNNPTIGGKMFLDADMGGWNGEVEYVGNGHKL